MKRREFIIFFSGAAAWPSLALAQSKGKWRLGALLYSDPQSDPQMAAIRRRLSELGYVEGRNISIEYRYAEGRLDRLPALAAELVALQPDVILAVGGDVAPIAKKSDQKTPLVFVSSADPEQLGLVASLRQPGGNATGVSLLQDELASKRLELLKEAVPNVSRVAFIWYPDHLDNEHREAQRAAQALSLQLHSAEVRNSDEVERVLNDAMAARIEAIYVVSSRLTVFNLKKLVLFAGQNRIPLVGGWGAWAKDGGLFSYGPDAVAMAGRAADHIDKIFKGAKPSNLPVEQPAKFELIINLKTAAQLGLNLPHSLLSRADELVD
ncbi:ABC transporter substrate-binding protein [Bradyrhizobium sp.]|uniref:ABC transporter substrate-binding protein n=1 Tax=Bradyrhizobium sp. TaxID=376 RepID=UPI001E0FC9DD|nr:ABC transporter substrate-binding protein [Bradyrhizobium sp.]MBI5322359.1 ABC transporter substrate-binding protein [Bradyrhizobium sp.]